MLRGQIPVTLEDFKKIPDIVGNPDNIEVSGKTKDNKPVLTFSKEIGDNYYVVNYVSDRQHNLEVQTMYKHKKNNPSTTINANNSLNQTSETNSGMDYPTGKKPSTLTNSIAPSSTSKTQGSDVSSTLIDNNISQSNSSVKLPPAINNSNMQNSENNTQNNLSKSSISAKNNFETTNDFSKAGFIIENGEMLNFSDGYIQSLNTI